MDAINQFFTADLSLWGLFLSSLLGATLLPGGSELVLIGVLKLHPDLFWTALFVATIGNTLGGMISFGMGWMLPRSQQIKHVERVQKYGAPILLLAWTPLIGDALCIAAGWLRLNIVTAMLFMTIGKLSRYLLIILTI